METLMGLAALSCLIGAGRDAPADAQSAAPGQIATSAGVTYYIDSRSGRDANSGTSPALPWQSLDKVNATTFRPGDRILFRSGSAWRGQLWPKGSGTQDRPITVGMYGGGVKPIFNGDGLLEDTLLLKNQEYWEISDLELTNRGSKPAVRRAVHAALENYGDAHHLYFRSLAIHDVNGMDSDRVKYNGGIIYTSTSDKKPSRFIDLRIENNDIYHVDRSGIFGWADSWLRSRWNPSLGVIVRGNQLHDIGGDGIVVVATDGAIVEHNVVAHANQRSEGYNIAIWAWSADNTLIQYNEAYATKGQRDGEGFDSDWNSRNTVIQYNYSHDNDGGFLLICNEGGLAASESAGNTGTIIRYNISQNDRTRGIAIAGPIANTMIYNNTIYSGADRSSDLLLFADWHGWSDATSFFSNIFYSAGTARFSYGVSRDSDGAYTTAPGFGPSTNNRFDANLYYGLPTPNDDAHALTTDPLFIDPSRAGIGRASLTGFFLQPSSPARATAVPIPNKGAHDFWGNLVPSCNKIDRGASQSDECRHDVSAPAQ